MVHRITYLDKDSTESYNTKRVDKLYIPKGNEGKTVKYDSNGDGTIGDTEDIAIASYNNAITTINNYCKTQVTVTDNVRSVGASKDTSGSYSSTTFDSWSTKLTEEIKAGDTYFEQDMVKMSYWGVSATDDHYWIASRCVGEGSYIEFEVRYVHKGASEVVTEYLWKLQNYRWSWSFYSKFLCSTPNCNKSNKYRICRLKNIIR